MIRTSTRGIFLSIVVLFSIFLILIPSNAYAEELDVQSIGLDETTIITLTNESKEEVKTFRIWLDSNSNFKSFKTEKGWIGEKNAQGVIIFTSSDPIKSGESVKFGIKTDKSNPIINWKGLDQKNEIIKTGLSIPIKLVNVKQNLNVESNQNMKNSDGEIFSKSTFRIIPDKPNSGSTIRVTGDGFGKSQIFDFYIDTQKIGNFETDEKGSFITTMKIPDEANERVDFKIKNNQGVEKTVSLRLGNDMNRISKIEEIKLTVEGIPNTVHKGDVLTIFGTGIPGNPVTIKIINSEQITTNTRTSEIDSTGNWKLSETITIPFDGMFGQYSIMVSDGKNKILKNWDLKTDKIILLSPTKMIFNSGELIKFNGTAAPNTSIELTLENQLGEEVTSKIINVDESSFIEFEYQSVENEDKEGTWTLIATQKNEKELIYFGYGVSPTTPINFVFNKVNYKSTETAKIDLIGGPLDKLNMIIINPAGNVKGDPIPIQLQSNGRATYDLKLTDYGSGIYTAVIKKGGIQSYEKFSVGLQIGSGEIKAETTQKDYRQGERILLIGKTNPNSLLTATLFDPNGNEIKSIEIPSNNIGVFTEEKFKIPLSGEIGLWKIKITSGPNLKLMEFNVFAELGEAMIIKVTEEVKNGDLLQISITASHKTSIEIEIKNELGISIDDTLTCNTTKEFACETFWLVSKELPLGTYVIISNDAISSAETTFKIIPK